MASDEREMRQQLWRLHSDRVRLREELRRRSAEIRLRERRELAKVYEALGVKTTLGSKPEFDSE